MRNIPIRPYSSITFATDCVAKAEWRKLREKYVRNKKSKEGKSGDGGGKRLKWIFEDNLSFLDNIIKHRSSTSNLA